MGTIKGGDSAAPISDYPDGVELWGVFVAGETPHIWSHSEVNDLGKHGIKGVLPIVVPPQGENWWTFTPRTTLLRLMLGVENWGVRKGVSIMLDLEKATTDAMGSDLGKVDAWWAKLCRHYNYVPWVYAGKAGLAHVTESNFCLAEWPDTLPDDPQLPASCEGWQYSGGGTARDYDLAIYDDYYPYMTPTLGLWYPGASKAARAQAGQSGIGSHILSAIHAQTADIEIALAAGNHHKAQELSGKLATHAAELRDLIGRHI